MFHFTPFRFPLDYEFIRNNNPYDTGWVVPFGNPRVKRLFAADRGLSQLTTSFIASWHQGIHHKPLVA
jgi:hypothetical protein